MLQKLPPNHDGPPNNVDGIASEPRGMSSSVKPMSARKLVADKLLWATLERWRIWPLRVSSSAGCVKPKVARAAWTPEAGSRSKSRSSTAPAELWISSSIPWRASIRAYCLAKLSYPDPTIPAAIARCRGGSGSTKRYAAYSTASRIATEGNDDNQKLPEPAPRARDVARDHDVSYTSAYVAFDICRSQLSIAASSFVGRSPRLGHRRSLHEFRERACLRLVAIIGTSL